MDKFPVPENESQAIQPAWRIWLRLSLRALTALGVLVTIAGALELSYWVHHQPEPQPQFAFAVPGLVLMATGALMFVALLIWGLVSQSRQ